MIRGFAFFLSVWMITTFCGSTIAADVVIGSSNGLSFAMIIFATFIEGSRGRFMKV